jgi:hypothetical protein
MKNVSVFILFLLFSNIALPQVSIRGGMGINLISIPSLKDYLNYSHFAPVDNQVGSFGTAVIFSGEATTRVAESYEIGVELAYLYNSYTFSTSNGQYNLTYGILMPTITNYYVIEGQGYNFKFGGGLGIRFINVNETYLPSVNILKSIGFGILLRATGNTALSSNVFANITGDIRYDINGEPKNNGIPLQNSAANNSNVNFNSFSLGLTLGITYIF